MSKKLEKLREVNAMIAKRCVKLETKIFIENSNGVISDERNFKNSNPKIIIETKH